MRLRKHSTILDALTMEPLYAISESDFVWLGGSASAIYIGTRWTHDVKFQNNRRLFLFDLKEDAI